MQHASPSLGALAAALAKAQVDLINPERSSTATLPPSRRGESERTFRYAPLSSGLDIIRKSLGRHEIAVVQRTEIDEGGLIRLTTVLTHSSGEWISSDWPVCFIAETATPHRLGAALTYARRYTLFALVGIAGEDDVDAPDLGAHGGNGLDAAEQLGAEGSNGVAAASVEPRQSRPRAARKTALSASESAKARSELEAELAALTSPDELVSWAARTLPAKNALTVTDANALEAAFERHRQRIKPADPQKEEQNIPPSAPGEGLAAGPASSEVALAIPKTPRRRDKRHLRFISAQPCLVCGRAPSDAHHVRFTEPRALGRKVSDEFTVPLCRAHHRALHTSGKEQAWWADLGIDPLRVAQQLWNETR
jgi:hypothetical protein